jgi:ATP-dependent Clp protease adaptor protein ClpS
MLQIHNDGKGYCGAFSQEIAETKSQQINRFSKENEHPLKTDIEELAKD